MRPLTFYQRLIKPIRDEHVNSLINQLSSIDLSPWDRELNFEERRGPIQRLIGNTMRWCGDWITGLDRFPHTYVANGNTDYINNVMVNTKGVIGWHADDYTYYSYIASQLGRDHLPLRSPGRVDDMVVSWPGYGQGTSTELEFSRECDTIRRHLDVAYLGLTKPITVDASEFDTIGISFSKSLSIPFNRISVVFSRREIPTMTMMNKIGYVNLSGVRLANHLMENLDVGYWWRTYGGRRMEDLCERNSITPTDCVLFGYSGSDRINLTPMWESN
jgi:hypothetical protein